MVSGNKVVALLLPWAWGFQVIGEVIAIQDGVKGQVNVIFYSNFSLTSGWWTRPWINPPVSTPERTDWKRMSACLFPPLPG